MTTFFFTAFFAARFFTGPDEGFFGMVADSHADTATPRGRRGAYSRFTAALFCGVVIAGLDPAIHLPERISPDGCAGQAAHDNQDRHCERSEVIQSYGKGLDCFVASAPRNDEDALLTMRLTS
ncbi:MAG: hypothetical protein JZU55_06020 [Afipia sp.]|nr:hypothetical protein [Afipia sp.]